VYVYQGETLFALVPVIKKRFLFTLLPVRDCLYQDATTKYEVAMVFVHFLDLIDLLFLVARKGVLQK
jgi:hypothetical protein